MKVTFAWSENVEYESSIEIDEAKFRDWKIEFRDWASSSQMEDLNFLVNLYLSEHEEVWIDQVKPVEDCTSIREREVDKVTRIDKFSDSSQK